MSPPDLEARLVRLENDNRLLRRLVAVLGVVAAAPLLAAYVPANEVIEASEFVLRDRGGAARARLFLDEQGKTRLQLRDGDDRSTVLSAGSVLVVEKDARGSLEPIKPIPAKAMPTASANPLDGRF
ncbi:MAG: hypothetical protein HYV09_12385 [Deltaproteobacteria bacterium]|nr:hypothetical protein [Deltaproteobacteria bacterium]